jgi:hypothetical protein
MYVYERLSALLTLEFAVPSHRIALRARLTEDFLLGGKEARQYTQRVQALFPRVVSQGGQPVVFITLEESVLAVERAYALTLDSTLALIRPVLAARLGTNRFDYDTPLGDRFTRHDRAAVAYGLQGTFDTRGLIGKTFTAVGDLAFYIETQLYSRRLAGDACGLRHPEAPLAHTHLQSP